MAAWATKEQDARPAEAVGTVPLLEMRDIRKSFFGVEALKGVDLVCFPGEVRAIVGENGAGKSTLMKILAGVHRADAGTIRIGGQAMHLRHPRDAQMNGVSIIYQELRLLPERSVAENVFLGREPARRGLVDAGALARATADLLARLGMARAIAPEMLVRHLSVAQQQMVEIAKALSWGARIVVMDEPTAALSHHEVEALFTQVEALRAAGLAVVYISHRLNEVFRLAQRITVLKDGVTVADVAATDITSEQLVEKMVGRKLDAYEPRVSRDAGEVRVRVRDGNNRRLAGVQLTLHAGEILGVAGLEGSGRTELARALFGDAPLTSGTVEIDGRPVALSSPRAAIGAGIGFLTEDRKSEGILPDESVLDNARLALRALGRRWRRARGVNGATASMVALMRDIDVRAASWDTPVQYLSGGNQQKVVLAKWLAIRPRVLLFDEPTRGIDVGGKRAIHDLLHDLAEKGAAILMISSELPEVLALSDRILVMHEGRIAGELPAGATEADVMRLAMGTHAGSVSSGQAKIAVLPAPSEKAAKDSRHPAARIWTACAVLFLAVWLGVAAEGHAFLSVDNLRNMLVRSVALGIVALGQSLVLLVGSIDLSVAYLISVAAVASARAMHGENAGIAPAIALALGIGAFVGLVNGLLVTRIRVNAFMATLGTGLVMRGVLENGFAGGGGSTAGDGSAVAPPAFQQLGYGGIGPVPYAVLLLAALSMGAAWLVRRTRFGYHLMAVGGDQETARVSGIRSERVIVLAHVLSALAAAISGLFLLSRVGSATPWLGPNGRYDLDSVAAAVLGGTAIMGGRGSIAGTVGGVLVLAIVDNALNQFGVNAFVQDMVRGAALIAAVAAYASRKAAPS